MDLVAIGLEEPIEKLRKIDFRKLDRPDELGQHFSFEEAACTLKAVLDQLEEVVSFFSVVEVHDEATQAVREIAGKLLETAQGIRDFRPDGPNPRDRYNDLRNNCTYLNRRRVRDLDPLVERARVHRFLADVNSESFARLHASAEEALVEAGKAKASTEELFAELQGLIESTKKDISALFGEGGAGDAAQFFVYQAEKHKKAAWWWLVATGFFLFLTFALVIALYDGWITVPVMPELASGYPRLVHVMVFKIVLLSLAYLVVHQCLRNYKVNRHLYVLNNHRRLALSVYPKMSKAATTDDQSNVIFAHAAKAIFEPGTTGYLDGDANPGPVNLTEIIGKVTDKT